MIPHDWRADALCRTLVDPDTMFPSPGDLEGQHAAKTVCGMCPAQAICLAWALDTRQEYGVFGGLTERERAELRGRRPPADPDTLESRPKERPDCGTQAGWERHKRLHQRVCGPCVTWRNTYRPEAATGFAVRPINGGRREAVAA